jgi:hypothetical protein
MAEDEDIRRARLYRQQIAAAKPVTADADPLAALQKSVAESKAQVQAKNVEIPTIALEQAVNTGDKAAIIDAAKAVAKAQGGSATTQTANAITAVQEATPQPTLNAANIARGDYIKWVGGVNGSWQIIKGTNLLTGPTGGGPTGGGPTGGGPTGGGPTGGGATGTATYTAPDGKIFTDLGAYNAYIAKTAADAKRKAGQSAFDLLKSQFEQFGLGGLVADVEKYIKDGLSQAEFTLRLRTESDAYKKRFAANAQRINRGLRALSEAEYITLEDQYQNVMRNYGLPASYYTRGDMGVQQGFEKFIAGDVSAAELEDRIQTAQNRVINAAPQVAQSLRNFYPEITGGDILAYALDPDKALTEIRRKVGAAEIGAGAMQAGLATGLARAEELQRYGVTKETAQQGFGTIASGLERGRQLSKIYQQPDYTQAVAETEVFNLPAAEQARRQRRRLGKLEQATFGGTTGMTGGALDRERAGQY